MYTIDARDHELIPFSACMPWCLCFDAMVLDDDAGQGCVSQYPTCKAESGTNARTVCGEILCPHPDYPEKFKPKKSGRVNDVD